MFTDCYCTQFRRSARALTGLYDSALKEHGLRITQFSTLRALERLGAATHQELAEEIVLDKTTMSRNVKLLAEAGWVEMEAAEDLRQKQIRLSRAGKRKLEEAMASWKIAQRQVLASATEIFAAAGGDPLIDTLEKLQALAQAADAIDRLE